MKNLLTGYDFSFSQFGIDQSVSAGLFAFLSYIYDLLQNTICNTESQVAHPCTDNKAHR